jgi:endonuclease III
MTSTRTTASATSRQAPARRRARPGGPADAADRPAPEALREKALEIHRRLCREYRCPIPYFHDLDPLAEFVSSLLSHRTRNADSGRAFKALRARFATWARSATLRPPRSRRRSRA